MDEQRYRLKKDIVWRIKTLHIVFTCVVLYFLIHILLFIMFNNKVKEGFADVHKNTIISTEEIPAHRGSIYSRNKEVLATSITRKTLYIDFGCERFDNYELYCKNADTLARELSKYFGDRTAREYKEELIKWRKLAIKQTSVTDTIKPKWYQFWKPERIVTKDVVTYRKHITRQIFREVDVNEWYDIKKFPLLRNGLDVTYRVNDNEYRVYPQGNVAQRVVGRREHHRSYGVEFSMRDTLAGHNGLQKMQTISPGYKTRVSDKSNIEPQNGYDVVTTLDIDVQDVAHNALKERLIAESAIWGTTIVMEVATGDILAMVNLKRVGDTCVEEQNYAIGVPVNPGSTFKIVSAMALLDKGVPTTKKYNSKLGARVRVGGEKGADVQDSHAISRETKGIIDMRTAFAESANVYFTEAVFEAFSKKPVEFSDYCRKLLLDKKVGLSEMGATEGIVPNLNNRHTSRYNALVNMAYGYGLDITPLHTISIYNAVANGGRMVAPRLVLRTERDGEVVNEAPVRVLNESICKPTTVDTLRMLMEEVSLSGTAKGYFGENVCSFRTGSKTGTSQVNTEINKVRYRKQDNHYYGSMVTYLPADKPRYTIMTAIFTKKQDKKSYYGASLAGPVQKQVATFLHNRDCNYAEESGGGNQLATEIKGGNIDKMRKVAKKYSKISSVEGRDGWGVCNNADSRGVHISKVEVGDRRVPNVVGMGLNDALYLLEKSGLTVEVVGYGEVVSQSLEPNTIIPNDEKRIKIELK